MTEGRVVLVTAPSEEVAAGICRSLLEEGLVACGNVVPGVRSLFRWNARLQDERESLILFKTQRARVRELLRRIPELHPYELPEILVLSVEAGHEPYLEWVARETAGPGEDGS